MANKTLDLRRDLESLYYLDERYFDSGANELKDRSGKRNHVTANGGPTVGVAGPRAFDATDFDGTDDYFVDGDASAGMTFDQPWTVAVIVQPVNQDPDNDRNPHVVNMASGYHEITYRQAFDRLELRVDMQDGSTNWGTAPLNLYKGDNEWYFTVWRHHGNGLFTSIMDGGEERGHNDYDSNLTAGGDELFIGRSGGNSEYITATIPFVGLWSRDLTDAEALWLTTRFSGPRRGIA